MGRQDEERSPDLDQSLDNRKRTLHGILHIRTLEELVDEHQPFLLIADLLERIADPLGLVKKESFSLGDIIRYIDIAQNAVEDRQPHRLRRNTHTQMRQKNDDAHASDERTLTR